MSGKSAKRLRQQARSMSGDTPTTYIGKQHVRRGLVRGRDGRLHDVTMQSEQAIVTDCTRSTYKQLKKLTKRS